MEGWDYGENEEKKTSRMKNIPIVRSGGGEKSLG
jgi:hypothetical protein